MTGLPDRSFAVFTMSDCGHSPLATDFAQLLFLKVPILIRGVSMGRENTLGVYLL